MVYLDTSAAVPLFVPELATDALTAWLAQCEQPLVASDWILPEFGSALGIKVRQGQLSQRQANAAWKHFSEFVRSGLRLISVGREHCEHAALLAREGASSLRAGDALHLCVAMAARVPTLATADRALAAAARARGLEVLVF